MKWLWPKLRVVGVDTDHEDALSKISGKGPGHDVFLEYAVPTKRTMILRTIGFDDRDRHMFRMSINDFSTMCAVRACQNFPAVSGNIQRFVPVAHWKDGTVLHLDRFTFPSDMDTPNVIGGDVVRSIQTGISISELEGHGRNVLPTNTFFLVASLFSEIPSVRDSAHRVLNDTESRRKSTSLFERYLIRSWARLAAEELASTPEPMKALLTVDASMFRRPDSEDDRTKMSPFPGFGDFSPLYPVSGILALASIGDNVAARALLTSDAVKVFSEMSSDPDEKPFIFQEELVSSLSSGIDGAHVRESTIDAFPLSLLMSESGKPPFTMDNVNRCASIISDIVNGTNERIVLGNRDAACFLVALCALYNADLMGPEPELDVVDMYPLMYVANLTSKASSLIVGEENE